MRNYIISYDLDKPGQNYSKITNELQRWSGKRVLLSVWRIFVPDSYNAESVKNHLKQYIDGNDRLIVIEEFRNSSNTYNPMN